ncbi:hypothetical protein ABZ252_16985 [Streptomyces sp. NPDC006175]|uniref:hypothetical protein n=1 Tax=Streptomyces sp. NPDC006175 TaxID=3154471 RepID=UPI0033B2832E
MEPLRDDDPKTVGGYALVCRIGAGGMGQVCREAHAYFFARLQEAVDKGKWTPPAQRPPRPGRTAPDLPGTAEDPEQGERDVAALVGSLRNLMRAP